MPIKAEQLEKALLEKGLLNQADLKRFTKHAKSKNLTLEEVLFKTESVPDDALGGNYSRTL